MFVVQAGQSQENVSLPASGPAYVVLVAEGAQLQRHTDLSEKDYDSAMTFCEVIYMLAAR